MSYRHHHRFHYAITALRAMSLILHHHYAVLYRNECCQSTYAIRRNHQWQHAILLDIIIIITTEYRLTTYASRHTTPHAITTMAQD